MVTCFLCGKQLLNIKILKSHFSVVHRPIELRVYKCVEDINCNREFQLFNSFRRHVLHEHLSRSTNIASQSLNLVEPESNYLSMDCVRDQSQPGISRDSSDFLTSQRASSCDEIVESALSIFIASLYANQSLPRNIVQTVISGFSELMAKPLVLAIKKRLENMSSNNTIPPGSLNVIINAIEPLLIKQWSKFDSEHKRLECFVNKETYIKPETLVIGERLERVKKSGSSRLLPITCQQHFIPLRKVLKSFFSLENVLSETIQYMGHLNRTHADTAVENFIQGSFCRSRLRQRQDKIVIPIFVFFDDYETGNALGSRAGQHKLGAVYASIPCLPPCRLSAL